MYSHYLIWEIKIFTHSATHSSLSVVTFCSELRYLSQGHWLNIAIYLQVSSGIDICNNSPSRRLLLGRCPNKTQWSICPFPPTSTKGWITFEFGRLFLCFSLFYWILGSFLKITTKQRPTSKKGLLVWAYKSPLLTGDLEQEAVGIGCIFFSNTSVWGQFEPSKVVAAEKETIVERTKDKKERKIILLCYLLCPSIKYHRQKNK